MAVQKGRKTPSRRDMRRSHDKLSGPTLSVDSETGRDARAPSRNRRRVLSWAQGSGDAGCRRRAGRIALGVSSNV